MFQRLLSKSIPCTRYIRVNQVLSLSSITPPDPSKELALASASEKAVEEVSDSLFLGKTKLPEYTMGGFPERMTDVHREYLISMKKVPGGAYPINIFRYITVYTWGEYVSLTDAADVKQLSPTSFRIQAFEPTFSTLIEVALKKSSYGFNVTRDFGVLTATLKDQNTISKEFQDKALTESLNFHKQKVDHIFEQAKSRLAKHPEAVQKLSQLRTELFSDMEYYKKVRLGEVKA